MISVSREVLAGFEHQTAEELLAGFPLDVPTHLHISDPIDGRALVVVHTID